MKLLTPGIGCDIYITDIIKRDGLQRRDCEREAIRRLVEEAFGRGIDLGHTPDGVPYVVGYPEISISISHSTSHCVLAVGVGSGVIGIDIESPRRQLLKVVERVLTESERLIMPGDGDESQALAFMQKVWTAKEAVYKAALTPGLGLQEIEISRDFTCAMARGAAYVLHYIENDGKIDSGDLIAVAIPE